MYIIYILLAHSTTLFLEYDRSYTNKTHILVCIKGRKESLIFSKIEDTSPNEYNEKYTLSSVCIKLKDPVGVHKNSPFFFRDKKSCLMEFIKDKDIFFFLLKIPQFSLLENLTFKMFYWDDNTNFKYETEIKYLKDLIEQREVLFDFRSDRGSNNIVKRNKCT